MRLEAPLNRKVIPWKFRHSDGVKFISALRIPHSAFRIPQSVCDHALPPPAPNATQRSKPAWPTA
jgi:hypothetical protein